MDGGEDGELVERWRSDEMTEGGAGERLASRGWGGTTPEGSSRSRALTIGPEGVGVETASPSCGTPPSPSPPSFSSKPLAIGSEGVGPVRAWSTPPREPP